MWRKLRPAEIGFFDLFTRHSCDVAEGARLFVEVLEAWPERKGVERIYELEHECDTYVRMTIDLLHHTFITPLDREEIVSLASTLDDVIDCIQVAVRRLVLFEIDTVPRNMIDLACVLERAAVAVAEMVSLVRGFKHVDAQRDRFEQLHALEHEGDDVFQAGLGDLFKTCANDPLRVIKLKEIYEAIERAIDHCEDVGNIVEGILLEHD